MALASALLKRYAITSSCEYLPWSSAIYSRDQHTKPIFRLPDSSEPLLFNVSHQAGLVCLLGVSRPPEGVSIGVDIACPSERRDRDHALVVEEEKDGWSGFVGMHESVFSEGEAKRLRGLGTGPAPLDLDVRLAYFYALWCLREAYVKMTGEALLADWLGELEMRNFAPPGEAVTEGGDGPLEIWFRGARVEDVRARMQWYEDEFLICTAVRGDEQGVLDVGDEWTLLDIDEILDAAERANAR
ncbi:hypothetical protein E4U10_004635 [Claviceps purpurea]|nr:hypothetical protein E4U10_004635 [Claviceps purpurea]